MTSDHEDTMTSNQEEEPVEGTSRSTAFSSVDSSFHQYPPTRPFINSDYQRPSSKPVMSFPESNRDGVLSALRSLQEKMSRLEVERREAESNLQSLATETELFRGSMHIDQQDNVRSRPASDNIRSQPASDNMHSWPASTDFGFSWLRKSNQEARNGSSPNTVNWSMKSEGFVPQPSTQGESRAGLESQLSSAETRCQLLEKQLDYMRKMVQNAETDRTEAMQKAETLQQRQTDSSVLTPDYKAQLERIGMLERDHLRLTATQTLAEAKIKELEEKLREERKHRQMLQDRALDLESAAISHRILLESAPVPDKGTTSSQAKSKKTVTVKKKKKKPAAKKPLSHTHSAKSEPMKHYRLNLAEIPFVAGKSTAPSHAVGANVQKVLAMMKSHNLALCSSMYNGHGCNGDLRHNHVQCSSPSLSSGSSISLDQDLADLLSQLQDEFGQLSFEHQELMRQIHDAKDSQIRDDLERELDSLVLRMEAKGQQISRVRQHQQKLEDAKRQTKKSSKKSDPPPRPNSAMGRLNARYRHCPDDVSCGNVRPKSSRNCTQKYPDFTQPSLNMLRDMRKLQSTLRRDDVCWE